MRWPPPEFQKIKHNVEK